MVSISKREIAKKIADACMDKQKMTAIFEELKVDAQNKYSNACSDLYDASCARRRAEKIIKEAEKLEQKAREQYSEVAEMVEMIRLFFDKNYTCE